MKKGYWLGKKRWNKNNPHPLLGKHHSNKSKELMRISTKKRWDDPEYRKHMSDVHKGQFCGPSHPNWKGGISKDRKGYTRVFNPTHPFCNKRGYVYEHRLVVEKIIGRFLTKKEVPHHIKEKNNNDPKNIIAFINKSAHMRFHRNPDTVKPEEIIFDGRKLTHFPHPNLVQNNHP